ncbi:sarcosine oxidase [Pseudaminobacter arsenicus]|uniref:Sarcosine oxidase n=1 Tax=Borborobacter arsenicus TaxID=1851146 RepID=A0A432V8G5_9HYPH|nr:sarcosine oxidase subunit gamma family protein [Pseudaminobacter arsenicus]RUM98436.1 sarcosine oxidase [Pseudaminobacter arsenicus]
MLQEYRRLEGSRIAAPDSALAIAMADDCTRFSLRIAEEGIAQAGKAFGVALPKQIGGMTAAGGRLALCLGPDEWQLMAPLDERDALEAAFAALYAKVPHSLVDISHREVGIVVEGRDAALALRSACPLDLDEMAVGSATRTIFDKAQIVLIRQGQDSFRIEVWQSFADHVWGILQAAGREIALEI